MNESVQRAPVKPEHETDVGIAERFIAAVLKDDTGERWRASQQIPCQVFDDFGHRKVWAKITSAETFDEAFQAGLRFLANPTIGAEFLGDRWILLNAWLQREGPGVLGLFTHLLTPTNNALGKAVSAADLCATPPEEPPELIQGLLYESGTMMLSSHSKGRKTYTMLAAGIAVAGGYEWLGFQTAAAPVLYLNLELQDFAAANRLHSIAAGMGVDVPANLHVMNLRGKLVTLELIEASIAKEIKRTGARLVIIDPHYKISSASGIEENSNDSQAQFLYRLENAICPTGAAVMVAHHFSKGDQSNKKAQDRAAGGGALARWPDVVMTLTEHQEPDCVTADFSLRNFAPVEPFVLHWEYPVWTRTEGMNPAALKKAGRPSEYTDADLLAKLVDNMSNAEWRKASGWSDGTFRRVRDKLTEAGRVRVQSGCYYHANAKTP